jgi:cell envelope opacity-associated protein A
MDKYDQIARWTDINRKLEASWTPLHPLVAERDEIEKALPWLKGHGASPYPEKPKTSAPPPSSPPPAVPPPVQNKGSSQKQQKRKKPENTEEKMRNLAVMQQTSPPSSSPSSVPLHQDTTQNF